MPSRCVTAASLAVLLLLLGCGDERPRGERPARADDPLWWTGGARPTRQERGLAALRRLRDRACACPDPACSTAVTDELMELSKQYADLQPGSTIEAEAGRIVEALLECATRLTRVDEDFSDLQVVIPDPDPLPPPPDLVPPPSATGVPECDAYVDEVRRFASCSKLPQASRDALEDSLQTMTQAWSGPGTLAPDTQKLMADACTQGAAAMRQSARVMGCGP